MNRTIGKIKTAVLPEGASKRPELSGLGATTCSRFGEERAPLLSKLSAMHDQYCHCMGRHPSRLLLTPYSAGVLGWEEGDKTPFYATVESVCEMADIFTANANVEAPPESGAAKLKGEPR